MRFSRNFMRMSVMVVLAALLIPICGVLLHPFLFSNGAWQLPFFSLFEALIALSVLVAAFTILITHYLLLEKTNEKSLEETKIVIEGFEKQLQQNSDDRERFELFAQATGDGIWDWNLKENKFYFSSRWKSMLGFSDDEFEGSFVEWQNLVHPDDLGELLMMWAKCTEGETSYTIEYRIKDKSGRYIWVASRTIALIDEHGDVSRLAGSHTDITDKKEAELKLRNHQKHLEAEISERTADLEQANKRLKELASIDGLTGLNNRRAFNEAIKREWSRCKRDNKTLSLIMLDIDYFKQYNDTYGHLEGDIVLKKLSEVLTTTVKRATDIIARYGGEEFVVILPDADEEHVMEAAHKIQENVANLQIPAVEESEHEYVAFSMGIGTIIPGDNNSWKTTLEQVDQALYRAKETGRNRIVVSPLNVVNLNITNVH